MTVIVRKPRPRRRVILVDKATVARLLRFPAVRREISKALVRAVPERAEVKAGWKFYRFRLEDPAKFHKALYAVIPVGRRGTLLVIGTPLAQVRKPRELAAFLARFGWDDKTKKWKRPLSQIQRRSLIYQLRAAGIIGGARTQAVLVPRERVEEAVEKFLARPAALRAVARNEAGIVRRAYGRIGLNPIQVGDKVKYKAEWLRSVGMYTGPVPFARGVVTALEPVGSMTLAVIKWDRPGIPERVNVENLIKVGKPEPNPILATLGINPCVVKRPRPLNVVDRNPAIRVPFRQGQKVSTQALLRWIESLPPGPFRKRYEKAIAQYRRFHLGALPKNWTFRIVPLGSQERITDIDFVVSEGKEWMAPYQVPPHSRKYNPRTEGRYIHAHGESKIGLPSISRPAHPAKLPERFHTPDGRFIGVVPTKNIKITDWYRG